MSKLRQDWVDTFQSQEGISLIYVTVTDTINATTGSKTGESTADSAAFTAIFEPTLEDDSMLKAGEVSVGTARAFIPKSFNAAIHDRIKIVSTSALWKIVDVDQRKTHDDLTLVEYTRV